MPDFAHSLAPSFSQAITRRPAASLAAGETTAELGQPDHDQALEQFTAYVQALKACELEVEVLEALEAHPDGHFVEDTAVVTPEVAVISRPGAPSRRQETAFMAPALARHRQLAGIEAPGTLDGGDVLQVGRQFLVGISERTNTAGAEQLAHHLEPHGYTCRQVTVGAGLHLKSSVNLVSEGVLLVTSDFVQTEALQDYELIEVPDQEEYACNTLLINGRLLLPAGYPRVRAKLEKLGLPLIELDTSEFRKMDGGLTCLSLRF